MRHLATQSDTAALDLSFTGTGIAVTLEAHGLPFAHLGTENLGELRVSIDDRPAAVIHPAREDRDVVVARGLQSGTHSIKLTHGATAAGTGARIAGFRVLQGGEGELAFPVHAEARRFLVDIRAIVSHGGKVVRNSLVRNWMTGQCRMAGLPSGRGYELELIATGWETHRIKDIDIVSGKETILSPVYLRRARASTRDRIEYPHYGIPAILKAGGSFATRVQLRGASIEGIALERRVGPALISRPVTFIEDKAREYDGHSEGTIQTPSNTPPGLYDLVYKLSSRGRKWEQVSPRSVHLVTEFPRNPVFVTFGHMDTWGQEQSEYLEQLSDISNLIAPDMVLVSNEVNAAYAAGAFSRLEMPYLINFGNHEVSGHEEWYGNAVTMTDFGPNLSILNFSHPWHGDLSHAYALLESRSKTTCKIINAFEHDAPVEEMLDRFRIPYIHEAHGPNPKVTKIGRTPTQRAGKENSESFRVVRFEGCRPVSFTYSTDPKAPIPFPRHQPPPLRLKFAVPNSGTNTTMSARVENDWTQDFPNGRVTFVMPKGEYQVNPGRVESTIASDDGRFVVVAVRADLPAKSAVEISVSPR
jgi:hypothetical protein